MLSLAMQTHTVFGYSDAQNRNSDLDIVMMLEYLLDNKFAEFGGQILQQTIGIAMETYCAPLLVDFFFYSYEAEFMQDLMRAEKRKVREKSRECHNHKPQPFPDPKRKRKPTHPNKHRPNKRTKSTKIKPCPTIQFHLQIHRWCIIWIIQSKQSTSNPYTQVNLKLKKPLPLTWIYTSKSKMESLY